MKVCFETFGCRLNRAEALQMEAEYLAKGWERTEKHSDADLFVVRGCSVTRHAQRDCEKLIDHLKRKYPLVPIRICGCLSVGAGSGRPEWAKGKDKERRIVFQLGRPEPAPTNRRPEPASTNRRPEPASTALPTRTARAYLKCQDGCSGKCTFCIVPKFRGASVSVPFDELVDKTKRFIDAGYHEIVLTGCNLALYASHGKRFPDLVAALAELSAGATTCDGRRPTGGLAEATGSCRIRIGSLEPGACALETVEAMAEHANVCRFLHIPVQSGSNSILSAMKRPYLVKDVDALVKLARERMPLIGLGCDMMTGFPGESSIDFEMSKGLIKRLPFSNAHVFPYSERPGTLAAGLPDIVPPGIRRTRARELSAIAQSYRQKMARRFIGHDVEIVIEDEMKLTGWTGEYFACKITNKRQENPKRKDLVRVHVMDANGDVLKAIMI